MVLTIKGLFTKESISPLSETASHFHRRKQWLREATPFSYASSCKSIVDRAASYGIPGIQVDGKDVTAVYQAAEQAIERAKMEKVRH